MKNMSGADYGQFPEILDDIEDALDAQELFQELFQPQMVAEGVRKVLSDSRISH
jgi:inorganic pyrophosphatase